MGTGKETTAMSLFDQLDPAAQPTAPPAPPPPPLEGAAYDAAVAAERAKFEAASLPPCASCGAALDAANTSRLLNGVVMHVPCPGRNGAPPPPSYGSIVPPDSPKQDMSDPTALLDLADPVSADEIAKITDPALKAKLEQHARAHAERAAAQAAEKAAQGGSVWCGGSTFRLNVTTEMAMDAKYKYTCGGENCGKSWTLKVLKPVKEADGTHFAIIPRHKPASQPAAPPPPPPAAAAVTAAPPPPALSPLAATTPPPPPNGHVAGPTETMVNKLFGPEVPAAVARDCRCTGCRRVRRDKS